MRTGLSQEELAERAGVSARAVSDIERGLRKSPRPETLRLLAEALALDFGERAEFFADAHAAPDDSARSSQREGPGPGETSTAIPINSRPLPRPLDALIGREADLETTVSLLESDQVRLVTLTGPGVVGKIRLCHEAASRLMTSFGEGVVFVDLVPLITPDQVAPQSPESLAWRITCRECLRNTGAISRARSLLRSGQRRRYGKPG